MPATSDTNAARASPALTPAPPSFLPPDRPTSARPTTAPSPSAIDRTARVRPVSFPQAASSTPSSLPSDVHSDGSSDIEHHTPALNATAPVRFMQDAIAANAPLVAVTGGLSYLGSHVVARMLTKGFYVRAIIPQGASTDFLTRLPGAQTRLQLVPVRDPAAEDARATMLIAYRGVSTVIHAASFSTHGGKLPKNVASRRIVNALKLSLDAASTPGNVVTNFIYISSELTVFDPSRHPRHQNVQLTENDWFDCSRSSRETTHAFAYAHTVAEMRLWARVGRGGLPFNVCSVIPSFVLGPILSTRQMASTPTISFFNTLASGSLTDFPDIPMAPVDVRDVARAITALTERPEIGGRILLCAKSLTAFEFLVHARREFPQYAWPQISKRMLFRRSTGKGAPDALKLLKNADFTSRERWGRKYMFSQRRAKEELGLSFRPVSDTIRDTLMSLAHYKLVNQVPTHVDETKQVPSKNVDIPIVEMEL